MAKRPDRRGVLVGVHEGIDQIKPAPKPKKGNVQGTAKIIEGGIPDKPKKKGST